MRFCNALPPLALCCVMAAGCAASSTERDAAGPGGDIADDLVHLMDIVDDFPPPGPPIIRTSAISPQHMTSNLTLMVDVSVGIRKYGEWYGVPPGTAEQQLRQAFSLKTLGGAAAPAGTLDVDFDKHRMTFTHTAPFEKDTDYEVTITDSAYVKTNPGHSRSVFHTGSLPRVKLVGFIASKSAPTQVEMVIFLFTEGIDPHAAIKAVSIKDAATGAPLTVSTSAPAQLLASLPVLIKGGHPMDRALELELGVDVGATTGQQLDGLYTGVPGSGPLKLTLVPSKHENDDAWVPSL